MTPQNINEIYAVIEVIEGKESGIMDDYIWDRPLIFFQKKDTEYILKRAKHKIEKWKANQTLKKFEIGGLLVKFTNREVISVFGGEI